jgi:hypothetical protein
MRWPKAICAGGDQGEKRRWIMRNTSRAALLAAVLTISGLVLCGVVGCESGDRRSPGRVPGGEKFSEEKYSGEKYRLASEPTAAQSIVEARGALEGQSSAQDVVLVGRIDGLSQPTWDPQRAAFMLADLSLKAKADSGDEAHDETPKHDAENCPFCKAKTKKELAGLAMVEVVDEQGTVPKVDARELLGLKDGQVVVVRGQGQVDDLGNMVVRASGLFVRP